MGLAWPVRSVIAGFAGTAAMALAYRTEHALRPAVHGQLDYDDSLVPGEIVASVLRLSDVTERGDAELGTALRWDTGLPSACGTACSGGGCRSRGPA